jgi:two-component system KDP operon response regulator KdpE
MRRHLVLVVDDEPAVQRLVRARLQADGHRVVTAATAEEAIGRLDELRPDLIVLDVMLPGIDGLEALRRVRAESSVPVLMLTARAADADKLRGLNAGADDYLTKPFNPDELAARVSAILRRTAGAPSRPPLHYPQLGLELDLDRRRVKRDGEEIRLSRTEWELLSQLAANPGRVLLHAELLSRVWGPEFRDEAHYLRTWVSRLRAKLAPDSDGPALITTFPGLGYRLELPEGETPEPSDGHAAFSSELGPVDIERADDI